MFRSFCVALLCSALFWQPPAAFAADGHPYVTAWGDDSDFTVQWPIDEDHTINGAETEETWTVTVDNYAENVEWTTASTPKESVWYDVNVELQTRYDAWQPLSSTWDTGNWSDWEEGTDMGDFDDADSFGPYPTHNSYLHAEVANSVIETYYTLTGSMSARADAGDLIGRHLVKVRLKIWAGGSVFHISEEDYTITHKYEESSGP